MRYFSHTKYFLLGLLLIICSTSLYAFINQQSKKVEAEYQETEIVLPNGRIIKDNLLSNNDHLYIPYELVEDILSEQIYWDKENNTLNIGSIPTASVMSEKLKIYHYDYDSIRSYLYCPDAKINKPMTMASETHKLGYYFTNVFSACFNLDNTYHEISGFLGCEDFKSSHGEVAFYLDDVLLNSYTIEPGDLPKKITLNVTGGNQLKLVFNSFKPDTQIDFADVYIK